MSDRSRLVQKPRMVHLSDELMRQVDALAREEDRSRSSLIRRALQQYVAERRDELLSGPPNAGTARATGSRPPDG